MFYLVEERGERGKGEGRGDREGRRDGKNN